MSADTLLKMSANTHNSTDSSIGITPADDSIGDLTTSQGLSPSSIPHLRYGFMDDGFTQKPLTDTFTEQPEDASFVSPTVYFLTKDQHIRLNRGTPSKVIQEECEQNGQAFFQVVAESDTLDPSKNDTVSVPTVCEWLTTFAEEYLDLPNSRYDLFYSGNRSIHLHTDQYVLFRNLSRLKSLVEEFCDDTDARLDTSIYKSKSQFRVVGARHRKTGLYKVPVDENDTREDAVRKSTSEPDTTNNVTTPTTLITARVCGTGGLLEELGSKIRWGYIKDSKVRPLAFSPYANTGAGGSRSLCVFRPEGEVTERADYHYIEGHVLEARGGNGYPWYDLDGEVKLSKPDARKWDFDTGTHVAIIGGQSRKSRMMEVSRDEAYQLKRRMRHEGKGEAVQQLRSWGYDPGESGLIEGNYSSPQEQSKAAWIKGQIDKGEREPDYDDIFRVSCRLLRVGSWETAWGWIKRTFDDDFKPEQTYIDLRKIVEQYEDFNHVEVPPPEEAY